MALVPQRAARLLPLESPARRCSGSKFSARRGLPSKGEARALTSRARSISGGQNSLHVSFGKVCEVGLIACKVRDTDVRGLCGVSRTQVIVLFQCKLSTSGQARMKDAAFVEELSVLKPTSRRPDILTSEFGLRRLWRTSPTPTHYCVDVCRIIGLGMKSRMVLASPGPVLTPPPSSSPPKTPHRSCSARTPPRYVNQTPPLSSCHGSSSRERGMGGQNGPKADADVQRHPRESRSQGDGGRKLGS